MHGRNWICLAVTIAFLAGCAEQAPPAPSAAAPSTAAPIAAAPATPPAAPVPFDQAVSNAGNAVLKAASAATRQVLVIDPLVNGVTGEQSAGTQALGARLADLARRQYPQYDVEPFNAENVAKAPLVMVGTFTPVNAQNQPAGAREAYRFCLVMADLKSGKTVAKNVARATLDSVDAALSTASADSPAWTDDAAVKSYINTCQATKVGDAIPATYLNGIITAAMVSQAIDAYEAGHYREALGLYESARATPAGDQLRIHNGLYLSHTKLNQPDQASVAFGNLVDYGLHNNRLAVKFLFRPASTALVDDPRLNAAYPMWLQQIAARSAKSTACLQVTGHTSASGSAVLNERLSVLRAEYIKARLEQEDAALHGRLVATGEGAAQPLIGTGADNASDVLDRRVEFKVIPAC